MTYSKDREEFIAKVAKEGLPVHVIRTILAKANTLQRIAELSCSSETVDRDRVPCPGIKDTSKCICDYGWDCTCGHSKRHHGVETIGACCDCTCAQFTETHSNVPRIDVQEARIKLQMIRDALDILEPDKKGRNAKWN